jgi:hypothetical protein
LAKETKPKRTAMKKHILVSGLLTFLATAPLVSSAQSFDKGTTAINIGVGLGGSRYSYLSAYNSDYSVSPTFNASVEHGVGYLGDGVVGIGAFFGQKSVHYDRTTLIGSSTYHYDRKWTNTVVGMRGSFHYNEWHGNDKLDLYAGLMLGYNIGGYKDKSTKTVNGVTTDYSETFRNNYSFVTYTTYVGGRYLFTENIGAFLELGWGVSVINLGATLKF